MKTMYMHTLDDHPASWSNNHGGYIYFAGVLNPITLQPDLKTIRKQHKHDAARNPNPGNFTYGYRRVIVS